MTRLSSIPIALSILILLTISLAVHAEPIGRVDFVSGHVSLTHLGVRQTPQEGTQIAEGDSLMTDSDGEIHLDMVDGAALSVRPSSAVTISKYGLAENDHILLSLTRGALRSVTGWLGHLRPSRYSVQTPNATIGIRGTDHETTYEPDGESAGTYERVFEGSSFVQDSAGKTYDATPGIAVAGNPAGGGFRHVGERELPRFILLRARQDGRFEKRFSQKIRERIRDRFSRHLTELKHRDPAAAERLQKRMEERFPKFRELKGRPFGADRTSPKATRENPTSRATETPQSPENRPSARERRRALLAQREQHRKRYPQRSREASAAPVRAGEPSP